MKKRIHVLSVLLLLGAAMAAHGQTLFYSTNADGTLTVVNS
ncbi:MAG TPA: hypothetical protein VGO59_01620 [Verrucomicrobiae bacterium]